MFSISDANYPKNQSELIEPPPVRQKGRKLTVRGDTFTGWLLAHTRKIEDKYIAPSYQTVQSSEEYVTLLKNKFSDKLPLMYHLAINLSNSGEKLGNISSLKDKNTYHEEALYSIPPKQLENLIQTVFDLESIISSQFKPYPSMNLNNFLLPYEDKLKNLEHDIDSLTQNGIEKLVIEDGEKLQFIPEISSLFKRFEPSLFLNILSNPKYSKYIPESTNKQLIVPSFEGERMDNEENDHVTFYKLPDYDSYELSPDASSPWRMTLGTNIFAMPSPDFLKLAYSFAEEELQKRDNAWKTLQAVAQNGTPRPNTDLDDQVKAIKPELLNYLKESKEINSFQSYVFALRGAHLALGESGVKPKIKMFGLNDHQRTLLEDWKLPTYYNEIIFKGGKSGEGYLLDYDTIPLEKFLGTGKESIAIDSLGLKLASPALRNAFKKMNPEIVTKGSITITNSKDGRKEKNTSAGKLFTGINHNSRHNILALIANAVWIRDFIPFIFIDKDSDGNIMAKHMRFSADSDTKRVRT